MSGNSHLRCSEGMTRIPATGAPPVCVHASVSSLGTVRHFTDKNSSLSAVLCLKTPALLLRNAGGLHLGLDRRRETHA